MNPDPMKDQEEAEKVRYFAHHTEVNADPTVRICGTLWETWSPVAACWLGAPRSFKADMITKPLWIETDEHGTPLEQAPDLPGVQELFDMAPDEEDDEPRPTVFRDWDGTRLLPDGRRREDALEEILDVAKPRPAAGGVTQSTSNDPALGSVALLGISQMACGCSGPMCRGHMVDAGEPAPAAGETPLADGLRSRWPQGTSNRLSFEEACRGVASLEREAAALRAEVERLRGEAFNFRTALEAISEDQRLDLNLCRQLASSVLSGPLEPPQAALADGEGSAGNSDLVKAGET